MILQLTRLPPTLRGPEGADYHGKVPPRMLMLAPDAAASLLALESACPLVYTDIFRGAAESHHVYATKAGTQRPGFSAHGFGLAIDVDVTATCKLRGWTYERMCDRLAVSGWYCHRRDHKEGPESWHFNFLGKRASLYLALTDESHATWSKPIEARIVERYQRAFELDGPQAQAALSKLGYYHGVIDGIIGHETTDAIEHFQTDWGLRKSGLDDFTQRTLAYVSAEVSFVGSSAE